MEITTAKTTGLLRTVGALAAATTATLKLEQQKPQTVECTRLRIQCLHLSYKSVVEINIQCNRLF